MAKPDRAARVAINFDLYKPWVVTRLERLIRRECKRAVEEEREAICKRIDALPIGEWSIADVYAAIRGRK